MRRSPYQGLIPYGEDDAAWFFGRDRARDVVLDNLRAYRLSVLYGPSGVGKSSLLRAGVVRHVRDAARGRLERGEPAEYAAVVFGSWSGDPIAGLQRAIGATLAALSPELAADLPGGSLAETVGAAAERLDGALLIVLDQFEEYFLYHPAGGPFVEQLARMRASPDTAASVLISIREDALARLDALTGLLPGLLEHLVSIEHLDRAAAREAIEKPLERWNRERGAAGAPASIEPALVEAVLDGVQTGRLDAGEFDGAGGVGDGDGGRRIQAPYLQLVLTRLWEQERSTGSSTLHLGTLVALHGAERIVATHVEQAMATLSTAEQAVAARILRQLVTPSGTKIALRTADLAALAELDEPAVAAVLERLTRDARILQAIGDTRYELYHDALARPILDWRRAWQHKQDRARQLRRYRTVASIAAGLALVVVLLGVLAWQAVSGHREAERRTTDARAVALAFAANGERATQPDVSLLLALAALRHKDLPETRDAMLAAREAAGPDAAVAIMRGHADDVNAVAFVEGGRAIASAADDGKVLLWDATTHRRLGAPLASTRAPFMSLAASADGRTLAGGAQDGTVRLWDVASRRSRRLSGSAGPVRAVALSPDGRLLASAGDERLIRIWDVASGAPRGRAIAVRDSRTLDLAFSPDGRTLASTGSRYEVRLWNVRSRRQRGRTFTVKGRPLTTVAFSPDGRTLAIGGGVAMLADPRTGHTRRLAAPTGERVVNDLAFSPDGRRVAAAGESGHIGVWSVRSARRLRAPVVGPTAHLDSLAFSPDGRTLAAAGGDKKMWLFDAVTSAALTRPDGLVNDVAFDRAGTTLASAGSDKKLWLWDVRSRVARPAPFMGRSGFFKIALSPDAARLASTDEDGALVLWNLRSRGGEPVVLSTADEVANGVALSPDGRLLASGYDAAPAVVLHDLAKRPPARSALPGDAIGVRDVAFSPDGRLLAAGGTDKLVRLWDLRGRRYLGALPHRHEDAVNDVSFSPDGATLASAGTDGRIWLWDVAERRSIAALVTGRFAVLSVAFTTDGRTLVAGGDDGRITLWDVGTGRMLGTALQTRTGPVNAVAVSPDGRTFASGGGDARLWSHILWRNTDELAARICALVGSGLSRAEFHQYAAGIPYTTLCDR